MNRRGFGSEALGRYEPGLDGVRAMAVVAVLLYHGEFPWAKGGFLGISLFFTLSGFLITSILLRQHQAAGTIKLRTFWARRYRRLLPAAYLTLAGVVLFAATVATEQQLKDLPREVIASILQVVNWFFVFSGRSYVDLFAAPSPVQHFWSLSIEEQFYVFMPLALLVLLRRVRSLAVVGSFFVAGVLASTTLMFVLYERGASLDRLYYGTDTRVGELLVGCVLAVVLHVVPLAARKMSRTVCAAAGIAAFVVIIGSWTRVDLVDAALYRGGFLFFALLSAALIVSVLTGAGPLPVLLGSRPLAAIGRISYGVYLFHWPIFLWLTEERTHLSQWPCFALRVAVTFTVAIASYNLLEMPVRKRAFHLGTRRTWLVAGATVTAIVVGVAAASSRDVQTNLAGIDQAAGVAPTVPTDKTLDVLVISDARGAHLQQQLQVADARRADLRVQTADPFGCTQVATGAKGPACANWTAEFPRRVRAFDPDVVVFDVNDWSAADIARLSGARDFATQLAWTTSTLNSAFDALAARGAPIVWSPGPLTPEQAFHQGTDPFLSAMEQLTEDRPDLRHRDVVEPTVTPFIADLHAYRRRAAGDLPRIMVVGDSSSRTVGYGLEKWGAQTGAAVVWSAGIGGCGIADTGQVVVLGRVQQLDARCRDVQANFKRQVAQFHPDLVIVLSTIYDLQQRKVPGWSNFRVPGDPGFDTYLADQYAHAYDILTAGGARVLWFKNPCSRTTIGPWPVDDRGGPLGTKRIQHVNEHVLPQLQKLRPGVRFFDLYAVLCPNDKPINSNDGVKELRNAGVHFTPDGSMWFAEHYGSTLLQQGLH